MSKLIILRGNSGSGKTTVAKALQHSFPQGTVMNIGQDEVRRDMLNIKDDTSNLAVLAIETLAIFGCQHYPIVIIEGILSRKKYGHMLDKLQELFDQTHCYYFDLSFETTVSRHQQRIQRFSFSEINMANWWLDKDYLKFENEKMIGPEMSQIEIVKLLCADVWEN
ncbi:AAA family ATPase [Enterococcus canintestini]|uniref:AAA family ATPase n=1 Tax=Enterococcus canintestini TaxID=317010 RepID=UPI00288E8719|nr:AAA family ATPase [Enterococcus canintestini]MDT2740442.1 AAA family ATPase [Enterococcus canintestini]